ncbi:tetratricopeptide repeat protein [Coleofasciculus sp. FACHB-1120]|uniref:tetratricopeptide repeat protein n=1 Tax=Coleofasciculus sp. FACHB-1120 TaxID=2692783 RepID=UPI001686D13D|nr:tetratricopeptide repeat protein [Coleofasciculus sp. FACHB-1120]MBD2743774.1 tetratricopeptide repeat protein [Coleofasciculus sp. FACHB-1120]
MGIHLERARLLIEQSRYEMAEQELRQELAMEPDSAIAHTLLALCLNHRQMYPEATQMAQRAIRLAPDWGYAHYVLAYILCDYNQLLEAETVLKEALRLSPDNPSYFALLSRIRYNQQLWHSALEAATQGLVVDPEDVECLNYRAMCLMQLGRLPEAQAVIESAIALDPEYAGSYANRGWILLAQGGYPAKALECFREALRLQPTFEWARRGILEALKAKNPLYRLMLRYFLWSSRLSHGRRLVFSIGLYFVFRLLVGGIAATSFNPLLWFVVIAYCLFVLLTWIADPLFTLLLRFDRFGRLTLSEQEVKNSNLVGAVFLSILMAIGLWLVTKNTNILIVALSLGLLLLPITAMLNCPAGWPRKFMATYTIVLAIAWLAAIGLSLAESPLGEISVQFAGISLAFFWLGSILSSWLATLLMGVRPKQ